MNLWWKKVFYLQTESQRCDNQLPPLLFPAGLSIRTLYIHDRCSRGSCDHCCDWRPGSTHLDQLCRWCRHGKLCSSLPSFRGFWENFVMDSSIWNNDKGLFELIHLSVLIINMSKTFNDSKPMHMRENVNFIDLKECMYL